MFACRDIVSVVVPSFIKIIDSYSFARCKQLKKIEFEENSQLQSIETAAFSENNFERFVFPSSIRKLGRRSFLCCHFIRRLDFDCDTKLEKIGDESFCFDSFENLLFPQSVNQIGFNAFSNCPNLITVEYLGDLVSIDENSFTKSPNLSIQSFPNAKRVIIDQSSFIDVSDNFSILINSGAELVITPHYENVLN